MTSHCTKSLPFSMSKLRGCCCWAAAVGANDSFRTVLPLSTDNHQVNDHDTRHNTSQSESHRAWHVVIVFGDMGCDNVAVVFKTQSCKPKRSALRRTATSADLYAVVDSWVGDNHLLVVGVEFLARDARQPLASLNRNSVLVHVLRITCCDRWPTCFIDLVFAGRYTTAEDLLRSHENPRAISAERDSCNDSALAWAAYRGARAGASSLILEILKRADRSELRRVHPITGFTVLHDAYSVRHTLKP